ncbi:hypothetical protein LC55x_2863 [Lysobacter capsici]|nr:hypothetical protein LC55x_2863 [Lysobacter capsici]
MAITISDSDAARSKKKLWQQQAGFLLPRPGDCRSGVSRDRGNAAAT